MRRRIWTAADVEVTIETDIGRSLFVCHRGVQLCYDLNNVSDEDERLLDRAIEQGTAWQLVSEYDRCARLDSIYSYPVDTTASERSDKPLRMNGARYLQLLR